VTNSVPQDGQRERAIDRVSEGAFEIGGLLFGLSAAGFIGLQVLSEFRTPSHSSLSIAYVVGFLANFSFWIIYGVRFRRWSIQVINVLSALLQAALLVAILLK
jgi:uncharacterized protein with PQ loop repeat